MTTFTIDPENHISVFATAEEAAASSGTPFDSFTNAEELAELATAWSAERLLAIWNSVDGLTKATEIKDPAKAAKLIFKRLDKTSDTAAREKTPMAAKKSKAGATAAKGTSAKGKGTKKAAPAKDAPKGKKAAKEAKPKKASEASSPREGSKMAQAVALMQRKNGVTLQELMDTFGWQSHTCRGFVAGAVKKAGYDVESFKPEGGERTYRLPAK